MRLRPCVQALLGAEARPLLRLARMVCVAALNATASTPPHLRPLAHGAWQLLRSFLDLGHSLAKSRAVRHSLILLCTHCPSLLSASQPLVPHQHGPIHTKPGIRALCHATQAQPALQAAFELLPSAWALAADRRPSGAGRPAAAASEEDLLRLGDLSWLAPALRWGTVCTGEVSAAWATAMCQVRARSSGANVFLHGAHGQGMWERAHQGRSCANLLQHGRGTCC